MILNREDIKKLVIKNNLIEGFSEDNLSSGSYDVTLGSKILKMKKNSKSIDLEDINQIENMYEKVDITQGYELKTRRIYFRTIK